VSEIPGGTANWEGRTTLLDRVIDPVASAAGDDIGHYLIVVDGAKPGLRIELGESALAVGRVAPCDIVFQDEEVSRRHCTIGVLMGQAVVTDLKSTNGTFIDGKPINGVATVPVGSLLQIGRQLLKYERRSRREVQASEELNRDLDRAGRYVQSLLPAPISNGRITTDWIYLPSARLGGDVFGYHAFDSRTFAVYLVDVSGHGAESAMHAVGVMNVLRQRALSDTDFKRPAEVVKRLNAMFPMEEHASMFFTIWYGVFDAERRVIDFCSGGHHPSYLLTPDRKQMSALRTPNLAVGVMPDADFVAGSAAVPEGATLYVFSDGVFEIITTTGERWELENFLELIPAPTVPDMSEPRRLHARVKEVARPGGFDDDFSLLTVTFG
jgi:serine phosphatase RsbU (regulator of sigma subunit)